MSEETQELQNPEETPSSLTSEIKNTLGAEIKETAMGLVNTTIGDVLMFWNIFKTIGKWIIWPISLNVREVERLNRERAAIGKKATFFNDYLLIKSIFILSIAYLVIDETAGNPEEETWIMQFVFLLFFLAFLFVFIMVIWIWKTIISMQVGDTRVFVGYIIYEYATIYLFSFVITGPLKLDALAEDADGSLIFIAYFLPFFHAIYWMFRLMGHYQLSVSRKIIGALIGIILLAGLLIVPVAINHVFLLQGLGPESGQ